MIILIVFFSLYAFLYGLPMTIYLIRLFSFYKSFYKDTQHYPMYCRTDLRYWGRFKLMELLLIGVCFLPLKLLLLAIFSIDLVINIRFLKGLSHISLINRFLRWKISFYCRFLLFLAGFYYIPTNHLRIKQFIKDYPNNPNPNPPPIVIANHVSWVDSVFLLYRFKGAFIAKREMMHYPIIKDIAGFLEIVYVNRASPENREGVLQTIEQRVKEKRKFPLVLYPEGTTSNGTYLLSFKKGAFFKRTPLKIVCLKYPKRSFNPMLDHITGLGLNILLAFCQGYNSLEVFEFDAFEPRTIGCLDWEKAAEVSKGIMADCLGVKVTGFGFKESMEYGRLLGAEKLGKRMKKLNKIAIKS